MAILWQKNTKGARYEVRSAGRTRRLYTDGVFHSQYNPGNPLTGGVWDLLMLPAFFYPPGEIRRVLVLGVGGGAVIHQLGHFVWPESITGIELNPVHLQVARRFFGLKLPAVALIEADAWQWVHEYRGPRFDMIIDDVFGEQDGEPVRAIEAGSRWMNSLMRCLDPGGMLVMNFISRDEFRGCGYFSNRSLARRFDSVFSLANMREENVVGAFLRQSSTVTRLGRNLAAIPRLHSAWQAGHLASSVRKISRSFQE